MNVAPQVCWETRPSQDENKHRGSSRYDKLIQERGCFRHLYPGNYFADGFSPCKMKMDQRCSGDPLFFHNYTCYTSMLLRLRFSLHILDIRYSSIIFPNKELHKILLESRIRCEELKKVGVPQSDVFLRHLLGLG